MVQMTIEFESEKKKTAGKPAADLMKSDFKLL